MSPVKWVRGNVSGRQDIEYGGAAAYQISDGQKVSADNYQPRIIAKVLREPYATRVKYFQVRTRTSVNMTNAMRLNMALMGGSGALFAGVIDDKSSLLYKDCVSACPRETTLRAWLVPILRDGLRNKDERIVVTAEVFIVNPWISADEPNVQVAANVLDKFRSVLSN